MQTRIEQVPAFLASGLQVRTRNADERDTSTARIGPLWGQFFEQQLPVNLPGQTDNPKIMGIYSNYESDATGAFDVTAGLTVSTPAPDMNTVTIEAGTYLVFPCEGQKPMAIIEGRGRVWATFENNAATPLLYRTDFEEYLGPQQAAIYIGIQ